MVLLSVGTISAQKKPVKKVKSTKTEKKLPPPPPKSVKAKESILYTIENSILKSVQFYQEKNNEGKYGTEILVDYEFFK